MTVRLVVQHYARKGGEKCAVSLFCFGFLFFVLFFVLVLGIFLFLWINQLKTQKIIITEFSYLTVILLEQPYRINCSFRRLIAVLESSRFKWAQHTFALCHSGVSECQYLKCQGCTFTNEFFVLVLKKSFLWGLVRADAQLTLKLTLI